MLSEQNLLSAALELNVEVAALKAIMEVESAGDGFIKNNEGKMIPKILFERHIMFKRLRDYTPLKSAELAQKYPDIVNPSSGGYRGGLAEHERLAKAIAIDRVSALESASWGAYQIMGFHWKVLGYKSIQEFVNAAYTDKGQLEMFVKFIKANPAVHKALKAKDWTNVAKNYNGSNYAKNKYDIKLKTAYEKFLKT